MSKNFLYFAFGSNLLKERLTILNPFAVFVDIAKLVDYQLCFDWSDDENPLDRDWHGCPATVRPCSGETVWGAVWRLNISDMPNLDIQEGVNANIYRPIEIQVTSSKDELLTCRTYQLLKTGSRDKRPSPHYHDVILRGAVQCNLPPDYIKKLQAIEHNGYEGHVPLYEKVLQSLQKSE